jgi:ABC-type glycerol-3-phosphate transport system substrate-binding protein
MQRERKETFRRCRQLSYIWLAIFCLLVAACSGPKPASPPPRATTKTILKVSCVQGAAADVLKRFSPAFEADNDLKVSLLFRAPGAAPDPQADLWIVEPAVMPGLAAAKSLQRVPESYTDNNGDYAWRNLLPLYRLKLLIWGESKDVFALPLADEAMVCCYRSDLLADERYRTEFKAKYGRELVPPATWQDITRIAEFFQNKPRPGIDRACPSLPPLPKDDDRLDRMFYLAAAPFVRQAVLEDRMASASPRNLFSFHYDLDTGKPLLHTRGFAAALECLTKLQSFRASGDDPEAAFASGEAVLCLAPAPALDRFQKSAAVKNKFGILRPPGSDTVYGIDPGHSPSTTGINEVPYLGARGSLMVVPMSTANGAGASKLAAFLSSPRISRDVATEPAWGSGIYREEHRKLTWDSFGLGPEQTLKLNQILIETYIHAQVSNPLVRLRIPDQESHRAALLKQVRAALYSGKKPADAMNDADAAWRELDARMTPAQRLSTYRLSISLGS